MSKLTKYLVFALGLLLIVAGGIYFYQNKSMSIGADEIAPSDQISIASTVPRHNSYKYKCKDESHCYLFVRYSSNVKNLITASDVSLVNTTATSSTPVEVTVDFPRFANYPEGSILRVKAQSQIQPGKLYNLTVSPNTESTEIEPLDLKFVAAIGSIPTIKDIVTYAFGFIIDTDFSGMTTVEIFNSARRKIANIVRQTSNDENVFELNRIVFQPPSLRNLPRTIMYTHSNYDSGVLTINASISNNEGSSETVTRTIPHIKPIKLTIEQKSTNVYTISASSIQGLSGTLANKEIFLDITGATKVDGASSITTDSTGSFSFDIRGIKRQINIKGDYDASQEIAELNLGDSFQGETDFLIFDNTILLHL